MSFDWGVGEYEWVAADLAPAAQLLVTSAAIAPGEHVVDVGAGTGSAALLAAELGARVTAVEPAARLREVAAQAAAARSLAELSVLDGTAADIPLPDGSADVVLSNFGVIMAPAPVAAADEFARVTAPSGRVLVTAWIPGGPMDQLVSIPAGAVAKVTGRSAVMPKPVWHDADAVSRLLEPHGFEVTTTVHQLTFEVGSPAEYWDTRLLRHPIGAQTTPRLVQAGVFDEVQAAALAHLEQLMPEFTVDYVLVEARR
ncbi:class I SAM-dependent methyltransferase [Kribbella sandramycini]|uniref:SAM-dependent methyltransferase n=1 Tax=Kribbella sandramycini TaxID=60450 RepID=A0A7Y4P1T9_9ACTN|nr:class I SAM-dependent methyltransferase [Kribbella sandramycini]MBB6571440.1 SAM-dependent methyltransferase [Kribbella sandramycini]NOL44091.1 class I SAM-dependent methyltransferase [Kribbella sandramycini]